MVTLDDCAICVSLGHTQEGGIIKIVNYLPRCWKHGDAPTNSIKHMDNTLNVLHNHSAMVNEYRRLQGVKPLCATRQDFFHNWDENNICKSCGYNKSLCDECQENEINLSNPVNEYELLCLECEERIWRR